jgi:hypothetical protein
MLSDVMRRIQEEREQTAGRFPKWEFSANMGTLKAGADVDKPKATSDPNETQPGCYQVDSY